MDSIYNFFIRCINKNINKHTIDYKDNSNNILDDLFII